MIDNPYFPLPVGRKLVYTGVKEWQTQTGTVTVTDLTLGLRGKRRGDRVHRHESLVVRGTP